jgi:hypothetical protein
MFVLCWMPECGRCGIGDVYYGLHTFWWTWVGDVMSCDVMFCE